MSFTWHRTEALPGPNIRRNPCADSPLWRVCQHCPLLDPSGYFSTASTPGTANMWNRSLRKLQQLFPALIPNPSYPQPDLTDSSCPVSDKKRKISLPQCLGFHPVHLLYDRGTEKLRGRLHPFMRVGIIGTGAIAGKHAQAYSNIGYRSRPVPTGPMIVDDVRPDYRG